MLEKFNSQIQNRRWTYSHSNLRRQSAVLLKPSLFNAPKNMSLTFESLNMKISQMKIRLKQTCKKIYNLQQFRGIWPHILEQFIFISKRKQIFVFILWVGLGRMYTSKSTNINSLELCFNMPLKGKQVKSSKIQS